VQTIQSNAFKGESLESTQQHGHRVWDSVNPLLCGPFLLCLFLLAPSGWAQAGRPDLELRNVVISSMSPDGLFYTGEIIECRFTVANVGSDTTGQPIVIELWDDSTGRNLYSDTVGILEPYWGLEIWVNVALDQAGTHRLRVKVDAHNAIFNELNEANNESTQTIEVIFREGQPDLRPRISEGGAQAIVVSRVLGTGTDDAVTAEDVSYIDYWVFNEGPVDAGVFGLELWDLTANRLMARSFLPGLTSYGIIGFQDSRWAFLESGPHELLLTVDSNNDVPNEVNEANNEQVKTIQVASADLGTVLSQRELPYAGPTYLQSDYRVDGEGTEVAGICVAMALTDIFAYWDQHADAQGVQYWNLIGNGTAPMNDAFPLEPGHGQGNVSATARELVGYYYHEKLGQAETVRQYCGRRGLAFSAAMHFQQNEATLWKTVTEEIDAGRPLILNIRRLWGGPVQHAVPVFGYRMTQAGQARNYFVKICANGVLGNSLVWANWFGRDTVDLDVDSLGTIMPGGTPLDPYEYVNNSQQDNDGYYAQWIEPNDIYGFRQTHNFADIGGGDGEDWIQFEAEAGRTYTIETENLGPLCDTRLELNASHLYLSDDDSGDQAKASRIVWPCTQSGLARVRITSDNQQTGPDTNYDICVTYKSTYSAGRGTAHQPYLITSARHLAALGTRPQDWGKHFKLMADLDLTAYEGAPFPIVGTSNAPFTGVFDGNGHTISNFTYAAENGSDIGLFGAVSGVQAVISNLTLVTPKVSVSAGQHVAALVGRLEAGSVNQCVVEGGQVSAHSHVGGLIGTNNKGQVTACASTAQVNGDEHVGELVGFDNP
jgi:hypothetical protein